MNVNKFPFTSLTRFFTLPLHLCNRCRMKLGFNIKYITEWGENLYAVIEYVCSDGSVRHGDIPMGTKDGRHWTADTVVMESRRHPVVSFRYTYQVRNTEGTVLRREWDLLPRCIAVDSTYNYIMFDSWRDIPLQQHLYTDAYITSVRGRHGESVSPINLPLFRKTILFYVSAPQVVAGQAVALCGSHPALGSWNISRYLKMEYVGHTVWALSVDAFGMLLPFEYKFVVVDEKTGDLTAWEDGKNRCFSYCSIADGDTAVIDGGVMRMCGTKWRVAGVALPVAALRSGHSYGVGDFGDLRRMVDWAVCTGMKVVQVLPVNDTGLSCFRTEPCPYNIVSAYALHPLYVDLEAAGALSDKNKVREFHRRRCELNSLPAVDYRAVERVKSAYLRELYAECGDEVVKSDAFRVFAANNAHWLLPYAVFCLLCEENGTSCFGEWSDYAAYNDKQVRQYAEEHAGSVAYIYNVQYLLHCQLTSARDYARARGVILKGDITCGVSRDSVDVWMRPEMFNLDSQAGTAPDVFLPKGCNWGFPTYDWDTMMAGVCAWWRGRLTHAGQYFDALRLEHVLGFFRMWEIPGDAVCGLLGHFSPALPFSPDEIERFGLRFRKEFYTRPFVNDKVLERLFGMHADYVRGNFLVSREYGMYDLRHEYNTQKKIQAFFEGKLDENSLWIRDGLYRLVENVLFVEDLRMSGMYHPRIMVCREPIFDALTGDDKEAFVRLYNHYYYQRHNLFWSRKATDKLMVILHDTGMLVCAESQGMLPDCVGPVLDSLRILSMDAQAVPRQGGLEFSHPSDNPYRGVAAFSTHDMAPMCLWWEENPERAQRYYTTMLQKEGRAPMRLTEQLAEEIVARHLYSPSMLCVLPVRDWLSLDSELRIKETPVERIGCPDDSGRRWNYRLRMTIEELLRSDEFNGKVKKMITRSRR